MDEGIVLMTMADLRKEFGWPLDAISAAVAMAPRIQRHGYYYMRREDALTHMLDSSERRLEENREIAAGRRRAGQGYSIFERRVEIYERRCAQVRAAMEADKVC